MDPYRLHGVWPDATHVLITHPHHDHLDPDAIRKLDDGATKLICPESVSIDEIPFPAQRITRLSPGHVHSFPARPITVTAKPAYNLDKRFHPEVNEWLGYVIEADDARIYHAGDTGPVPLTMEDPVELGLIPVDGIYTMNANEAAGWVDSMSIKTATPIHYGTDRGSVTDSLKFRRSLGKTNPVHLEKTRLRI